MKIAVVGAGYVGLANAAALSKKNKVVLLDILPDKVKEINEGKSPIRDKELESFLSKKTKCLHATVDYKEALIGSDVILVATPTDYDSDKKFFDTSSVEDVIEQALECASEAIIVIRSTIPVGYTELVRRRYCTEKIVFVPEFLREGHALHDSLYPSRIIVGDCSEQGRKIARLLMDCTEKKVPLLFTHSNEAEAIKLFSNTYLALRVAYFNELDSYAAIRNLNAKQIIRGVCLDPRIGDGYNNPSFGYGGYCLPKDTKQLLANYENVPQNIISAIVEANRTRKDFVAQEIVKQNPEVVGVYRLTMKSDSDNFRSSAILGVLEHIKRYGIKCLIYEPTLKENDYDGIPVVNDLEDFQRACNMIIANRWHEDLASVKDKVYTRDLFYKD